MDQDVRRIAVEDWPKFRQLRLEALQDSPLAFVEQYAESLAQPDEFWLDRATRGAAGESAVTFVAVRAGELVGKATCFVEPDVPECVSAHVVGVYVTPKFRGSGVAEGVVGAAVRWAREERGADRVRLFVHETNQRAMAFYRRLGFATTGATVAYPPDPTYTEYEMELVRVPSTELHPQWTD
jgi:ribosomal protein S18 acetylase RimI-like enzyme